MFLRPWLLQGVSILETHVKLIVCDFVSWVLCNKTSSQFADNGTQHTSECWCHLSGRCTRWTLILVQHLIPLVRHQLLHRLLHWTSAQHKITQFAYAMLAYVGVSATCNLCCYLYKKNVTQIKPEGSQFWRRHMLCSESAAGTKHRRECCRAWRGIIEWPCSLHRYIDRYMVT